MFRLHLEDVTVFKTHAMEKIKDTSKTVRLIPVDYSNSTPQKMNEVLKDHGVPPRGDYSYLLLE